MDPHSQLFWGQCHISRCEELCCVKVPNLRYIIGKDIDDGQSVNALIELAPSCC